MSPPTLSIATRGRRAGATLMEVLVSLFVMAIGLIALLALFPVGILTMGQAIQDDRASNAAQNATALAIALDMRHDPVLLGSPGVTSPYTNPSAATFADAAADGPSYPVYVDPVGFKSFAGKYSQFVGAQTSGVSRQYVSYVLTKNVLDNSKILQFFSYLDDILFDFAGKAKPVDPKLMPPEFQRENKYSWAYLARRPLAGDPTVVEMSVVVYQNRPITLNNLLQADEISFNADFSKVAAGQNVITLTWANTQSPPGIRVGSWLMDTTPVQSNQPPLFTTPHSAFYRVVGFTQLSDTSVDVEVQQPIQGFPLPVPNAQPFTGTVVVMGGVVEVFQKGTGWHP
jgi:hypothetical protein